jgi:hypothetical protein
VREWAIGMEMTVMGMEELDMDAFQDRHSEDGMALAAFATQFQHHYHQAPIAHHQNHGNRDLYYYYCTPPLG